MIWFAGASYDPRRGYNGRQRGYGERDDGRFDDVRETDRVCGAAMLVPRAVLERDGLFDEGLFAYYEDTDWSLRAGGAALRRAGEPRPPPGVGVVGRRELAGDALLRHAQRARGRGAARAARGVRYVAAAGGAARRHTPRRRSGRADGGWRSRRCATVGATSAKAGSALGCPRDRSAGQAGRQERALPHDRRDVDRAPPPAGCTEDAEHPHVPQGQRPPDNPTTVPVAVFDEQLERLGELGYNVGRPRRRARPLHGRARRCPRRRC